MTDAIRAGLVGLGMMGRNHARVLRELPGVDLVAVADAGGDPHGAAGDLPLLSSVASLIATGIDMCVVAVPTEIHLDAGLALAEAGVATLIEKPLANTVSECDELIAAFAATNTPACVGHIERYNPALQALRARLEQGELGEIYQIATRRQGPFPNRIRDVGVVKDLATHDIDLTAWVAGSRFHEVSARSAHKSGREYEDLISVTGVLANGTVTNHLVNWLSPIKERLTVVTGERGCFIADTLTADLTFCANGEVPTEWNTVANFRGVTEGDVIRYAIPKPEPLKTEIAALRDLAMGLDADVVTLAEGRATLAVAEACIRSAETGTTVAVGDMK